MNGNGYRETDLGQIPADWEVTPLGNVVSVRGEATRPSSKGTTKYVGLEHIDSGSPKLKRWGIESEVRSSKNKFCAGDILYGKLRPYLDKVALAEWEGMCATDILVLNAERAKGSPEYLVNLLHTAEFLNFAISTTTGVNHPRTSWNSVSRFTFGLPTLPEQKRIAAILSKIQQAIEVQGKTIERSKELKRALMAKLFTEGLHNEELKETEIGLMPKSWGLNPAEKICKSVTDGTHETPKPQKEGYWLITSKNLRQGNLSFGDSYKISRGEYDRANQRSKVNQYDILYGMIGTIGSPVLVRQAEIDFAIKNVGLFKLAGDQALAQWVFYFLSSPQAEAFLKSKVSGSTQKFVPLWFLRQFPLPTTNKDEREEITGVLGKLDAKVEVVEKKLAVLRITFASILHQLITGQLRVNNIETPFVGEQTGVAHVQA